MEYLILFLPLLGAIISGFFGNKIGEKSSEILTSLFTSISAILSIIIFIDVVSQDYENNLIPYFKLAGIVCLPSHREGMPKSILEGLASGIPIVTTNTIGCNESILPGVNGELANLKDPVDLASKLEGLIINSNKRMKY